MLVLVLNAGSSSLKAALVAPTLGKCLHEATAERVGTSGPENHTAALAQLLPELLAAVPAGTRVAAVGHRVVHGGERFTAPTPITPESLAEMSALIPLAPLHMPANVACAKAALEALPDVPHVAVFDTAFHATLPRRARTYALPTALMEKHGIRRYGFHGPSHQQVSRRAASFLGADVRSLRIITCHLGSGCSVCAVEYGTSVETSMGMTPMEGLVMGTRSGDVDPGVLIKLLRDEGLDADALDRLLNRESGLHGLSGVGHDLRDIEARASEGDEACRLAIQVFAHRVRKTIGAYAAAMGGVDVIAFTGGIGENSALMRHRIAQRLDFLGAPIDEDLNRDVKPTANKPVVEFSHPHARCRLVAVHVDEQLAIAEEVGHYVQEHHVVAHPAPIPVAVSARHVHLTQAHVEALFGAGAQLTPKRLLGQPGQFICEERVTLVGPRRSIEHVGIIGPTRKETQVEISRTDEFFLGVDAPVRESGQLDNTPGITLHGPAGTVTLERGVICAWRHIHMTPADALAYGVSDKDLVQV
jgi:acetate kinase